MARKPVRGGSERKTKKSMPSKEERQKRVTRGVSKDSEKFEGTRSRTQALRDLKKRGAKAGKPKDRPKKGVLRKKMEKARRRK